jgi:protein-S-isoprenylcysteine O-methyltransferase Ste14
VKTIGTASDMPAASGYAFAVTWLSRLTATTGYDRSVRIFGAAWFLILALVKVMRVFIVAKSMSIVDFGPTGWPTMLSTLCLLLFYLTLAWLILRRPRSVAPAAGILPSLVAFLGTYLPWTIILFAPREASACQEIASSGLLLIGAVSMVIVIPHLGHCFSIVPQARRLVRTGPYAVVRHPLYLVEEIALLGILVQFRSPLTLALFLAHGALQIGRMFYEEDLLRRSFPDYDEYARSTARLIPYIW